MSDNIDPIKCARVAAQLLDDIGSAAIQKSLAYSTLGNLLVNIRDSAADQAAQDVAFAAQAYVTDPSDANLAEIHRTLILWRSRIAA